jgi:multidrug resistance efflux pump
MKNKNDIELRSEEVQDLLTRVPHWMIRWGNIVVLVVFIILMLFTYIIKYPDVLSTQIVLTTQNPPEKIVARTSGKIAKILVNDRAVIEGKKPLAIIENTADYKDIFKLKECIDTLSTNLDTFVFPFEKSSFLQLGDIQNAFTVFEKDYIAYDLNRNLKPYSIEKTAQALEIGQLKERFILLKQQYEISQNELQLKKQELERYRKLHDKGVIASQEWESKNLDYFQSEKNVKSISSQLSQMQSSINDLNRGSGSIRINETKDNISLFRNVMQSYSQLKKAINDWELAYVLYSSFKGQVSFMQIWVENQTVNAGDEVFTIVPIDNHSYVGKVKAPILNSGKIKINQDVNIRLTNFPDREFGVIKGKVKSISLAPDREGNLLIDVSLPNGIETSYEKRIVFQQEMSGTADIITEDLRLIERLLYQFRDVFNRSTSSDKNP